MKKIIALVLPFTVLVGVFIPLIVFEQQRIPDWQAELNDYIAKNSRPTELITVRVVTNATQPWNFSASMGQAVPTDWEWSTDTVPPPSDMIKCVLVERNRRATATTPGEQYDQIIFISHHTDTLWPVGWLVYEGPIAPFTPKVATHLDNLGCDLHLDNGEQLQ